MTTSHSTVLVAPSILSADFANLATDIQRVASAGADWLHVDVMDGHFVPNLTIGPPVIACIRKVTSLPLDVHLMITDPDHSLADYRAAGADIITVHQEACTHLHRTLSEIRNLGAKAGVSLNPATPVEVLAPILDCVDLILVMSVNPGFGGQTFIPYTLEKLKTLQAMIAGREIHLEVDGGISPANAQAVVTAGATVLVAGSAIFGSADIPHTIAALKHPSAK